MTEPFKNADQRIREAFAALRAEIEGVFGKARPVSDENAPTFDYDFAMRELEVIERDLHDFAKQPASEG